MKAQFEKKHNYVFVSDANTAGEMMIEKSFKSRKTAENRGISHGARTGEVMTRKQFERMRK